MRLKYILVLLLAALSASTGAILAKLAYRSNVEPYSYTFSFTLILTVGYLAFLLVKDREQLIKTDLRTWSKLFLLGFLASTVGALLYFIGLSYTTATNTAFLVRLQAPFTVIFAYWLVGEKLTKRQTIAMFVMFVGAYLVIMQGALVSLNLGDLAILASAGSVGLANAYFKRSFSKRKLALVLFGRSIAALITLGIPLAIIIGPRVFDAFRLAPVTTISQGLVAMIYLAALYYGIRHVGAGRTTIFILVAPLLTAVMAYFILNESLVLLQALGAMLILAGGYLIIKRDKNTVRA